MGWQKRGTGRNYNSSSGVGTMIGNKTGKIVAYGIRTRECRMCSSYTAKEVPVPDHVCEKNWTGSSKAMESDVGVELVKKIEEKEIEVGVLIMDDDATTMAKLRQEIPHKIEKWSDINHAKKNLGKSLYNLQKSHKNLTHDVIKWLLKCFSYAVIQNKDQPESLKMAIEQITPHAFGDHASCGDWCRYKDNPDTYQHSTIKRDLSGETLRTNLESIFKVYSANAGRIAPCGSTKDVESFNNLMASKAPKRCHFSASSNLKHRVACAVAQKNLGHTYISKINQSAGLSPGKVSINLASKMDAIRKRQLTFENDKITKKRKLERKLKKSNTVKRKEVQEGKTYESGVDMSITDCNAQDLETIPPATYLPPPEPISDHLCTKVICDIETTSLSLDADIIQIAAISGDITFNEYITPTRPVAPAASAATGFVVKGGVLFNRGTPLSSITLTAALTGFIAWLDERSPVVLIGHNFRQFDFPRILRAIKITHLTGPFQQIVAGCIDTLPMFRQMYPHLTSHKQEDLVSTLLNDSYNAHDALCDVTALQKLTTTLSNDGTLYAHSITTSWALQDIKIKEDSKLNETSFSSMVAKGVTSRQMAAKLASSGLTYHHLLLAFRRAGEEGVKHLLSEKCTNGKARVTSNRRIISCIINHLQSL